MCINMCFFQLQRIASRSRSTEFVSVIASTNLVKDRTLLKERNSLVKDRSNLVKDGTDLVKDRIRLVKDRIRLSQLHAVWSPLHSLHVVQHESFEGTGVLLHRLLVIFQKRYMLLAYRCFHQQVPSYSGIKPNGPFSETDNSI